MGREKDQGSLAKDIRVNPCPSVVQEGPFLHEEETWQIIGCAMEVLNGLGHGLLEKPYENALVVEFGLRNIPVQQQSRFDVIYKGVKVGDYVPDLIAFNQIVVDTKAVEKITDLELAQILNYLKITRLRVGIILNFKRPKLEWKRVVL
ncbi:MAG: GxxExxY protein [Candidatus Tectomicrobia bacterium]|nr:GxxExxY protein [Candidatus Tectomicrobia bacterium]